MTTSMTALDATEELVDALKQYFSAPIARALLTSTLRHARMDGAALPRRAIPEVVTALERTLPMYIADATRRGECLGRLRKLVPRENETAFEKSTQRASGRLAVAKPVGTASTVLQIMTADDVANACEVGRDLARRVGFLHVQQTKIATAIAELARNILLYAVAGEVRIAALDVPRPGVEVHAIDEGPGIADLELVMSKSYRSRTGMGMGLKGSKRLMDIFEIESNAQGTTVLARKFLT